MGGGRVGALGQRVRERGGERTRSTCAEPGCRGLGKGVQPPRLPAAQSEEGAKGQRTATATLRKDGEEAAAGTAGGSHEGESPVSEKEIVILNSHERKIGARVRF